MARAMELPAIVGVRGATARLADGDRVVLDGVRGLLVVHPSPARAADYDRLARSRQQAIDHIHAAVRVRQILQHADEFIAAKPSQCVVFP